MYNFRGLMLAAVAFIGLALFAMGYTVWKLRSDAINDAFKDSGNVATVLAQQTAQSVRAIDLVLGDLQERIVLLGVTTPDGLRRAMTPEYGHALLQSRLERFPEADIIAVVDADGNMVANSRVWPTPPLNVSDRDYFRHFKNSNDKGAYISIPVRNRVTDTPTVFFCRPIRDENDVLLGVIGIGIRIAQFRHIYETVDLLGNLGFTFARTDGTIIVRYPNPGGQDRVGQKIPSGSPWYDAVAQGGGTFRSEGRLDPDRQLVSLRLIPGYPLAVNVGVSEKSALVVWRQTSTSIGIGTALALICSAFLLSGIATRVRLLKNSEVSLAEQKEILAAKSRELEVAKAQTDAAVNNITQGISMFDSAQRLVVCNARYLEIYGLWPSVVKPGCTFQEILDHRKLLGTYIKDANRQVSDSASQVLQGKKFTHTATLPDGRIIAVVANPTFAGGWVATHEDITERHRADALISHMARHDALTDLPNRIVFEQKLGEALVRLNRYDESFAVLLFDLDRFKSVNDTLGHPVGDALLKAVAERLLPYMRELDTLSRLGGDEFAILQTHIDDPAQGARTLANRMLDAMSEPFALGGHQLDVRLSIGIALAPRDGANMELLVKNADLALYRAKSEGRNRFRFFDSTIDLPAQPIPDDQAVA